MSKSTPSVEQLAVLSSEILEAAYECDSCFVELLYMFPNSAAVVRKYAQFLFEVRA